MALKILVLPNHLQTSKAPYIVRAAKQEVVDFDHFADIMADARTSVSKTEILAVFQLFKEELAKVLRDGKTVRLPIGVISVSARGTLKDLDEAFLPGSKDTNHGLRLHLKNDKDFEDSVVNKMEITREDRPVALGPVIKALGPAGESGTVLHKAGVISLKGLRLRFDTLDINEGVFCIDGTGLETRVGTYPLVLPGTVLASLPPNLGPGTYSIVLKTKGGGKDIKIARVDGVSIQ